MCWCVARLSVFRTVRVTLHPKSLQAGCLLSSAALWLLSSPPLPLSPHSGSCLLIELNYSQQTCPAAAKEERDSEREAPSVTERSEAASRQARQAAARGQAARERLASAHQHGPP